MMMARLATEPARPRVVREHRLAPWLAVGIVCFGAFMGQLDASIVTLAFPAMQHRFGVGLAQVQWVSLSYLLVLVALLVPVGKWSDRAGRKLLYLYGFAAFSLASVGCGFAPSLAALIAFRVVQAAGAAMLQANSIALVSTSVPGQLRRTALGFQAVAQAAGLALGPVAGGVIVASAGWRWVFLINPPVGLVAIAGGILLLPRTRHRSAETSPDLVGVALLGAVVTGTLLVVSAAAGLRLGLAGITLAGAAALAGGGGLAVWERRVRHPLLDRSVLAATGAWRGLAGALFAYLVLFGPLVLYPQVLGAGVSLITGLTLAALPAGFAAGAVLAERLLPGSWTDSRRCLLGGSVAVLACGLLAVSGVTGSAVVAALLGLLGLGLGCYIPANNAQIMGQVPAAKAATAGGMVNMSRGIGTAFGVAVVAVSLHLTAVGHGVLASGTSVTMLALTAFAILATALSAPSRG